jgi:hypothetical protein
MSDEAKRIEREFDRKCKSTPMFKEFVELHSEASMAELLEVWEWVQALVQKAIHRTIRDLTQPPPPAALSSRKRDN